MDALSQVLGKHEQIMSSAQSQQALDMAAYDAELAKTEAAKADQQQIMQEQLDKREEIMATPEPPRPSVPTLAPLPAKPADPPEDHPLKTFGQMIPLIAALASSKTQESAIFALNASTAALNAMEANDQKALAKAHQDWMDNVKSTLDSNAQLGQQYNLIINDRQMAWNEKLAKLEVLAAESKDRLAMAALKAGNPEAILKRQEVLNAAAKPIQEMYTEAERQQLQREEMQMRRDIAAAQLAMDAQKMDDVTLTDVVGRIALKMSKGQELSPGEQSVWSKYDEWRKSNNMPLLAGMAPAAAGGDELSEPAPAAPAAPAPGTPAPAAPAPSAAPSAPPPVSMLKEGVVTPLRDKATGAVVKWTLRGGKPVRVG